MRHWIKPIFLHSLYWICNVLFFTIYYSASSNFEDFTRILKINLSYLPPGMLFAYFSILFLIPRYIYGNKVFKYILYQSITLLAYPVLTHYITIFIIDPYILGVERQYGLTNHLSRIIIFVSGIVPLASYRVAKQFVKNNKLRIDIEKQKLEADLKFKEAELSLLKAQIQPHFLFNTLNNLYSLAIEKSDKTPEVIMRISDMLSYVIYDCSNKRVSLAKEFEFLKNYIELEKLRYDESLQIDMRFSGEIENIMIAPMILFTFVENSFKHGASKDTGSPSINISIEVNGDTLNFIVENSRVAFPLPDSEGIGLQNVKKRLEMIYPQDYRLEIIDDDQKFHVNLKLNLAI